jgi:hypothetical protein
MIEFIGPSYNWLQQFTNHYLTHCHLLPTGHSTELFWLPPALNWTTPLYPFNSHSVPSYNSSVGTPRKTPSSVLKNASLLVHYLAMDVLLWLTVYASGMCLPSHCLAMDICITLCIKNVIIINLIWINVMEGTVIITVTSFEASLLKTRHLFPTNCISKYNYLHFIQNKALCYTWNNLFVLYKYLILTVVSLISNLFIWTHQIFSPLIFLFKPEEVDYLWLQGEHLSF